eukprot:jgi/Mesen1/2997/ME000177S02270
MIRQQVLKSAALGCSLELLSGSVRSPAIKMPTRSVNCFAGLSLVRLQQGILTQFYKFKGLKPHVLEIDSDTTVTCWAPDVPGRQRQDSKEGKKKTPLLLLHGFGASAIWQWSAQVGPLSASYDVYMPDLVFFGGSSSRSERRTETFQAECMAKALDMLQVGTFDVVGISYGGFVACRLAEMYPDRVRRVALTDSGVGMTAAEFDSMLARWRVRDMAELLLAQSPSDVWRLIQLAYYKPLPVPEFLLRDTLEVLFRDQVEEKRQLLVWVSKYARTPPQKIDMQKDVLLIWGEFDEVFPVAIAERLQKELGGNTSLVVIRKACHMPNGQRPGRYNRCLLEFLDAE